jgi:hypothetical protein
MIEKERDKWQPRLQGHDPGIASVDHQDLDSGAGEWWFSMGVPWGYHGLKIRNSMEFPQRTIKIMGKLKRNHHLFFGLGLIFSDLMMNSWGDDAI